MSNLFNNYRQWAIRPLPLLLLILKKNIEVLKNFYFFIKANVGVSTFQRFITPIIKIDDLFCFEFRDHLILMTYLIHLLQNLYLLKEIKVKLTR